MSVHKIRSTLFALMLAAGITAASAPVAAQSINDISERLRQIDQVLNDLQRAVYKGEVPPPSAVTQPVVPAGGSPRARFADIEIRLSELEGQIRSQTGQIETVEHQVHVISSRVDKLIGDIDFRLSAIERNQMAGATANGSVAGTAVDANQPAPGQEFPGQTPSAQGTVVQTVVGKAAFGTQVLGTVPAADVNNPQTAAVVTPAASAKPKGVLPGGSVRQRYDFAYGLLRRLKMQEAEVALKEFLGAHEADPLADNARYWLGESYYSRRDYTRAAATFFEAYSKSPTGPKARDNLYKLGKSLARIEQKDDACASFDELLEKFKAPVDKAIRQRAEIDRTELGCQ